MNTNQDSLGPLILASSKIDLDLNKNPKLAHVQTLSLFIALQSQIQWRNLGTITLAMPGAPLHGGTKLHEYLFSKIRLKDGRRTKNYLGITEPELTTVNGQKIIRGITKAELTTVDGQKLKGAPSRQKPGGGR